MSSMWYGSLNNRIDERRRSAPPEVGMGATEYLWSDRHAYEVIAVKDDRHVTVRRYKAIRTDNHGMSDWQDYRFESDPEGVVRNLFLTNQGVWRERIGSRALGTNKWYVGSADEYYDYSF